MSTRTSFQARRSNHLSIYDKKQSQDRVENYVRKFRNALSEMSLLSADESAILEDAARISRSKTGSQREFDVLALLIPKEEASQLTATQLQASVDVFVEQIPGHLREVISLLFTTSVTRYYEEVT